MKQRICQLRISSVKWALSVILLATTLFTVSPAFAALGEPASSVQADQAHLQGTLRTTQTQSYTIHEIRAATGTNVREYVSSSGRVFAVAWQGPWPPDMRQILGSYFEQYQQAVQAKTNTRAGRKPLRIKQPFPVCGRTCALSNLRPFQTCCHRVLARRNPMKPSITYNRFILRKIFPMIAACAALWSALACGGSSSPHVNSVTTSGSNFRPSR